VPPHYTNLRDVARSRLRKEPDGVLALLRVKHVSEGLRIIGDEPHDTWIHPEDVETLVARANAYWTITNHTRDG
jgi:hypothetical protein